MVEERIEEREGEGEKGMWGGGAGEGVGGGGRQLLPHAAHGRLSAAGAEPSRQGEVVHACSQPGAVKRRSALHAAPLVCRGGSRLFTAAGVKRRRSHSKRSLPARVLAGLQQRLEELVGLVLDLV